MLFQINARNSEASSKYPFDIYGAKWYAHDILLSKDTEGQRWYILGKCNHETEDKTRQCCVMIKVRASYCKIVEPGPPLGKRVKYAESSPGDVFLFWKAAVELNRYYGNALFLQDWWYKNKSVWEPRIGKQTFNLKDWKDCTPIDDEDDEDDEDNTNNKDEKNSNNNNTKSKSKKK